MESVSALHQTAADLRRAFDETFVSPAVPAGQDRVSLITIRAAGQVFAVRTQHIRRLARAKRILPIPSRAEGLLGITGLEGALLAVYDLASLLGLGPGGAEPAWLVLANSEPPVALAFEGFEAQVQVPPECLYSEEDSERGRHAPEMARIGSGVHAVLDVPGLVKTIMQRAGQDGRPRSKNR